MLDELWRKGIGALAQVEGLKQFVEQRGMLKGLAERFVPAENAADAASHARELLRRDQLRAMLTYLGEPAVDSRGVARNVVNLVGAVEALLDSNLDAVVEAHPSSLGAGVNRTLFETSLRRLAAAVNEVPRRAGRVAGVMVAPPTSRDEARYLDSVVDGLLASDLPLIQTVAADGREAAARLSRRIMQGVPVRLVKGSPYAENSSNGGEDGTGSGNTGYRRMLDSMFSRFAWEHRFYPIVATDDPRMHRHAMEMARRNGWKPGEYEFHLIYGVQPRTVSALRAAGQRVRVTLPFGTSWWDYVMRCVAGQSPRLWLRARMAAATRA